MQLGLMSVVFLLVCGLGRGIKGENNDHTGIQVEETTIGKNLSTNLETAILPTPRREHDENKSGIKPVQANIDPVAFQRLRRKGDNNTEKTTIIHETEQRILKKTNVSSAKLETCGGIFSQPQFIIETPNYPSNYPNNLDCLFIFKGLLCETNYTLQFLDFSIQDTLGCAEDRLEVKNRDALCGVHEGVKSYVAENGVLELRFVSSGGGSGRGFRVLVSRSACLKASEGNSTRRNGNDSNGSLYPKRPERPLYPKQPDLFGRRPDTFDGNNVNGTYGNRGSVGGEEPKTGYLPIPIEPPYPPSGTKPNHYLPPDLQGKYPSSYNPPAYNHNHPPNYPHYPPYSPSNQPASSKSRACCASTYSAKRFLITSPGFPHSNNNPSECTFTIYRANPRVCRMRMIFRYFSIGEQDEPCSKGYLQIDGKLLCGCRTGTRLLSPFDFPFGNTKVFKLVNLPLPSSTYTGFAIEIIQDECPERYTPPHLRFVPNLTEPELLLKTTSTEIFEPVDLGFKPRVVKHVYFFDTPQFYDDAFDLTYPFNKPPRDVEESTYIDTYDLSPSFPKPSLDNTLCSLWGLNQFSELTRTALWRSMPKCNELNVYPEASKCKDYNFIKGYFQSPGYPYYYPKNLNICYRFSKQRGFCKIRLMMLDFQVDQSYDCGKDYLLINGNFRYCGQSLANTFTLFDMIGKNYEEIKFITDGQSSGRGFRGVYEQIPCEGENHRPPDHHHVHTTTPPPKTTTASSSSPCSSAIVEEYFTVDIYDYGKDTCDFVVRKSSEDVCGLDVLFSTFDIDCSSEYILINDEKFCGKLPQKEISFIFDKDEIDIKYKRFSLLSKGMGLKLHLVGKQTTENCIIKLPPVQRIINIDRRNGKQQSNNSTIVVFRKKLKEICGVVLDAKTFNKTQPFCQTITDTNDQPLQNCSAISDKTYYVPYNKSDKLELKFKSAAAARDVEFKEITCDNKFIL